MVAAQVSRGIPYLSANERLKMTFEAWLYASITVAAILHFVVLSLWPSMSVILHPPPRPPIEVIVPPSPTIPPPPVDIPRPAIPVPGDVAVELDPMISALDEAWARVDVPLVPPAPSGVTEGDRPFTPFEVAPRMSAAQRADLQRYLERRYPPALRDAGISAGVRLSVFIDANGNVVETKVATSSGYSAYDAIATEAMQRARFIPAKNRDINVPVWIEMDVKFQSQ
jgi:periplasmic protein TonB